MTSPSVGPDDPGWPLSDGGAATMFKLVVDAVTNGVSLADARLDDRPLVYVNSAFERMTGYSAGEVLGRNCRFLQRSGEEAEERATIRNALAEAKPCRVVLRNYRKDGTTFWNDLMIFPLCDGAGAITHFVGIQCDVSDRYLAVDLEAHRAGLAAHVNDVTAQRASLASEMREIDLRRRFMETVLDEMPMGVITTDAGGRVTFMNRAARSIVGPPAEATSAGAAAALFADHPEVRRALDVGPDEARFELDVRAPDGRPIELAMTVIRASDAAPPDLGHVLVFRDVREQRLEAMRKLRDDRLAALGQMAMGFAHEVRNPLAAMSAICEAMAYEAGADDPQYRYAQRLLALIGRTSGIIQSTLHFGRPEPPRLRIQPAGGLLDEALDVLAPRYAVAGGRPRTHVAPGLPAVRVDGGQLVQALVALLDNALDAVGRAERVRVTVRPCGDAPSGPGVAFEVTDDGPGIAAEALTRVFDPFYTTKPQGTGLGLAIAQRLVFENGGHLYVSSTPEVVTTFRVVLPAVVGPTPEAPAGAAGS